MPGAGSGASSESPWGCRCPSTWAILHCSSRSRQPWISAHMGCWRHRQYLTCYFTMPTLLPFTPRPLHVPLKMAGKLHLFCLSVFPHCLRYYLAHNRCQRFLLNDFGTLQRNHWQDQTHCFTETQLHCHAFRSPLLTQSPWTSEPYSRCYYSYFLLKLFPHTVTLCHNSYF